MKRSVFNIVETHARRHVFPTVKGIFPESSMLIIFDRFNKGVRSLIYDNWTFKLP